MASLFLEAYWPAWQALSFIPCSDRTVAFPSRKPRCVSMGEKVPWQALGTFATMLVSCVVESAQSDDILDGHTSGYPNTTVCAGMVVETGNWRAPRGVSGNGPPLVLSLVASPPVACVPVDFRDRENVFAFLREKGGSRSEPVNASVKGVPMFTAQVVNLVRWQRCLMKRVLVQHRRQQGGLY